MTKRAPVSMRARESLSALIERWPSSPGERSELVKLATRLIVEEALEAEVRDALGRGCHEHGGEEGRGWRNGQRTGRLKTAEGETAFSAPQVAGRKEAFRSEVRAHAEGPTEALKDLALGMPARGLSARDTEDAFRADDGRLLLSRMAASELDEQPWADHRGFAARDPGEHDLVHLRVDGIAKRIRPGLRREPAMAARGFTITGAKVLLGLIAGSRKDAETVAAFFRDMRARGLGDPLLVVSDGAPGKCPPLKWSAVMMRKAEDQNGNEALQADLDARLVHHDTERPHLRYRNQGSRPIETVMAFVSQEDQVNRFPDLPIFQKGLN